MRKFLIFVVAAALAALVVLYGLRVAERRATATITAFLPKETLFFAHLRNLRETRRQWRETDLYQLWHEPAVQEFLQKPLTKVPHGSTARSDLQQFVKIQPEDIFVAVTAWSDGPQVVGGFRFQGKPEEVEKVVAPRRAALLRQFPQARRATQEYQQHQIEIIGAARQTLATVYDGDWFFAANNLAELKALLDRADHRQTDTATTLAADSTFTSAFAHMPPNYAALVYARVDRFVDKLKMLLTAAGANPDQPASLYQKMHAVCGTLAFDGGKIRDVLFAGMPKQSEAGVLSRSSLQLGTAETIFYLATLLNPTHPFPLADNGPPFMQNMLSSFRRSGVTLAEWNAAFQPEIGLLGQWPQTARLPALVAALPVKNAAKAKEVLTKFTGPQSGLTWTREEKEGVTYFSTPSAGLFSIAPALALSDRTLVAGTNPATVETAMRHSVAGKSALAGGHAFQKAEGAVALPRQGFSYIDTALLYERLDAALRPVLTMGAAFLPAINENIDLAKWPPVETITKHLSPIVMSQNYRTDGYVTESIGPITIYQAAIGTALVVGGSALLYKKHIPGNALGSFGVLPGATASPAPIPTGSPSPFPSLPPGVPIPSPSETP